MENNLWNDVDDNSEYHNDKKLYQEHILEQYKIYVEMADQISARRNLANVFFLTLNTTALGVLGFCVEKLKHIHAVTLLLLIVAISVLCLVWWWVTRSYRNLNTAKYKVIGYLEKRLPASPYWEAEWNELGKGKDPKKYLPLSDLENFVPIIFITLYLILGMYVVFNQNL
jgi:hypothetical protein